MLKNFFTTENVEIEFRGSVQRAIENLGARVRAPENAQAEQGDVMVGSVTEGSTYTYRRVPGSRNSFRPTFYGRFSGNGERGKLSGEITLNRVIKKFIIFWCSVVALIVAWTLITVIRNPAASWGSLAYIVVMPGLCILFFRTMIKKCMPDIAWLKRELSKAISME